MLSKTRRTVAVALAASFIGAAPAAAMPSDQVGKTDPRQLDMHASTVQDARGENSASLAQPKPSADLRTADARDPVGSQPVVVEVSDPATPAGFDWTAAIIGLGAGLALAVLAGVGVTGTRRRPRTA
jgi:hypothetical protein